jgi:hypothetical protein
MGGPANAKPEQSMPAEPEPARPFIGSYGFVPAGR